MMLKKWSMLLVAVALLGADKKEPPAEPATKAPPKASIRGTIKSVSAVRRKGAVGVLSIDGKKEKDTQYDKATVTLVTGVKIYKWEDGKKKAAKFEDLKVGCVVQCDFSGPVRESYPVQSDTKEVLILSTPKAKK